MEKKENPLYILWILMDMPNLLQFYGLDSWFFT